MSLEKHKEILLEGVLKDIYKKMEEDGKKKQELRNSLKKNKKFLMNLKSYIIELNKQNLKMIL